MDRPRSSSLTGMLEGIEGWQPAEAFQDSDGEGADMLEEALVRGEMAQRRRRLRRRLVSRPRDILDEAQDTYGHLRELHETSTHDIAGPADANSDYDSSPDPLLRRRPVTTASIPRAESIFFPPSPDRNRQPPANGSSRSSLASRPARNQSSNAQRPRPVTLKPVLLLYCAAPPSADTRRPSSRDSLPPDFFYLDDKAESRPQTVSSQRTAPSSRERHSPSPDTKSGGGGCGVLICARAHTASGLDVFASQTPPPTSTVDWLEPITGEDEIFIEGDRARLGLTCGCKKAYLGCRVCGNIVGRATVSTCHRCKRSNNDTQPSKWTFSTSAVICAARKEGQTPASQISPDFATPLAASASTGKVMRWELGSVPFLDDDIKHGLAGDINEWDKRASAALGLSCEQSGSSTSSNPVDILPRSTGRSDRPWRYPDPALYGHTAESLRDPWPPLPTRIVENLTSTQTVSEFAGGSRPRRTPSMQPTFRFSASQSEQEDHNDDAEPSETLRRIRGLRQIMRHPREDTDHGWSWVSGPPSAGSGTGANAVELPILDGEEVEDAVIERPSRRRRRRSSFANEAGDNAAHAGTERDGRATRQRVGSRSESGTRHTLTHTSGPEGPVGR